MDGWEECWGTGFEEEELRLERLGVVQRERVLRVRAGGMCEEEEEEASERSSSLLEADEEAEERLGERGYLSRETGWEKVRLKSGRCGVRGVVG